MNWLGRVRAMFGLGFRGALPLPPLFTFASPLPWFCWCWICPGHRNNRSPIIDPPATPSPTTFDTTIVRSASELSASCAVEQGTPVWVRLSPDAAAMAVRFAVATVAGAARRRLPSLSHSGWVSRVRVWGFRAWWTDEGEVQRKGIGSRGFRVREPTKRIKPPLN